MTKTELIQKVAADCGVTQKVANTILDSALDTIGDELKAGNSMRLTGFGTFKVSLVKGREAHNPQDPKGAKIIIPDTNRVFFSAGQGLKDKVNETVKKAPAKKAAAPAKKAKKKK